MSNICYFEIPVEDMTRAQAFYRDLFQWRFEKLTGPSEAFDYWNIQTEAPDGPGLSFGGMMKKQGPGHTVTQYVNVDSVEEYLQKAQQLGGSVRVPKTAVPGKGYFAICLDPEQNPVGLWQCDEAAR